MLSRITKIVAVIAAVAVAQGAQAATVSLVSGNAVELAAGQNASTFQSNDIHYVLEAADRVLGSQQNVNLDSEVAIAAGTAVNVFMFFLNTGATGGVAASATVAFDSDILGVVYGVGYLNNRSYANGVTYGTLSGIETGQGDSVNFVRNQLTLSLNNANGTGDWIRVFTDAAVQTQNFQLNERIDPNQPVNEVPLPGSALLLPMGLAGLAVMRRRKRKA